MPYIFKQIKQYLTARAVAEHYGLKVSRNGMACCPFHDDRHPSMKIEKNYYCFACGFGGDAVDYTAKLFNISQYEAAKKLIYDFKLSIVYKKKKSFLPNQKSSRDRETGMTSQKNREEMNYRHTEERFQKWITGSTRTLIEYHRWLEFWKEFHKPDTEHGEWHPLFIEALGNIGKIDHYLDILLSTDIQAKVDFFLTSWEEVKKIERRIKDYKQGVLAEIRREYEECG